MVATAEASTAELVEVRLHLARTRWCTWRWGLEVVLNDVEQVKDKIDDLSCIKY